MRVMICLSGLLAVTTLPPSPALGAASGPEVTEAWSTVGGGAGGEALLYMTVTNRDSTPDALVRVRCPVDWAAEPRTTDRGEGALNSRPVKSIAIPPNATVRLEPGGFHVALLQLKEPLHAGDTFTCSVTFSSGPKDVPVRVSAAAETPHDGK